MQAFGEEIRRLRERNGLSQKELAEKAEISQSMLSRIENGEIQNPHRDTVSKLAYVLEVPRQSLQQTHTDDTQPELRIGFGHCLWAAPLAHMIMNRHVNGASLTSYSDQSEDSTFLPQPYFYNQEKLDQPFMKSGPDPVGCSSDLQLPGVQGWYEGIEGQRTQLSQDVSKSQDRVETSTRRPVIYTAEQLVQLASRGLLDAIAVPQDTYTFNERLFHRCANLMFAAAGCSLIIVSRDRGLEKFEHEARKEEGLVPWSDLSRALIAKQNEDDRRTVSGIPTFYAKNTVAERFWTEYIKGAGEEVSSLLEPRMRRLDDPIGIVDEWLGKDGRPGLLSERDTVMLIAWQPQIEWIRKLVEIRSNMANSGIVCFYVDIPKLLKPPKYDFLVFDFLVRRTNSYVDSTLITVLEDFFDLLEDAIAQLNELSHSPQSSAVSLIRKYLDMREETCRREMNKLQFRLTYYPEWVRILRRHR